jgi:hypothetical protein
MNEGMEKLIDSYEVRLAAVEEENKKLKKRAEEAEGENTIIKGIGNNSPEMKFLQNQNVILKKALKRAVKDFKDMEYERNILKQKMENSEGWIDQLRNAGLGL